MLDDVRSLRMRNNSMSAEDMTTEVASRSTIGVVWWISLYFNFAVTQQSLDVMGFENLEAKTLDYYHNIVSHLPVCL